MALYLGNTKITPIISKGTSTAKLITKSVDSNGVYSAADDDADGYSKFTVNVQYTSQEKTLNPSKTTQIIVPDSGYNGITKITLNPVTSSIDENIISSNIKQGVSILGVTGTLETKADPVLQSKTITPTKLNQTITPDTGYDALSSVIVNGVTSDIDSNITAGNIKEGVSILGVTGTLKPVAAPNLQNKSATPLTTNQTIEPDEGYDGLSYVSISKVDSSIDSNIVAGNIKKDISILGVTGTYEGDGSAYTTTQVYNALKANYDTNGTFTDNVTYTVKGTLLYYKTEVAWPDGIETDVSSGILTDGTTNLVFAIKETSSFDAEYLKYKISKGDCITISGKFKYYTTAQTMESISYNISSPYFDDDSAENIGIFSGLISKGINTLRNLFDYTKQAKYLFYGKFATNISPSIIDFNDTINVTDMSSMFYEFQGSEIPKINMNSATNAANMFYNTPQIKNLYLVMPKLSSTGVMFSNCKAEEIFIKNMNGITIDANMFSSADKVRLIDIESVSNMNNSNYFLNRNFALNKLIIRNISENTTANTNAFDSWTKTGYIYLPSDKVNTLKTKGGWTKVSNIMLPIFSKTTFGSGTITETVQEDGKTRLTAVPADGYTFAGWYNGVIGTVLTPSNLQELTITNVEGQTYGFTLSDAEASSTRYYESNNKGIGSSAAYGRFYFTITDTNQKVKMTYISYGETSYDYGIYYLNKADGTNVKKNENLGSSPEAKTIYFENLALGDYYLEVRYKKDSSGNKYNDSLKVKAELATYTTEQGVVSTTSETGLTSKTAETVEFKNVPEISQYGFALNTNGYYESNNKGIHNSVAVGRFYFDNYNTYTPKNTLIHDNYSFIDQTRLNITYISSGQYNGSYVYDYGTAIIYDMYGNKIREILNDANRPTNGLGATGISTSTYIDDLPTGRYYLEVRFIKNEDTVSSGNDSLQIKVSVDTYTTKSKSIPDSGLFASDATTTVLINEKYMQPLNLIAKFVQGE